MFTIQYKGFFIHGNFDRPACRFHREGEQRTPCASVHAAKCLITRRLRAEAGAA